MITADDLGISEGRNRGIAELIEGGSVDSASLLVTTPAAEEGAALISKRGGLGLHLNLTEGSPALDDPSVLGDLVVDGAFATRHPAWDALAGGRVDPDALASEVVAQLEAFVSLVGGPPAHIDGHQHVHVIPAVADAILAALEAMAASDPAVWGNAVIRIRVPIEDPDWAALSPVGLSPFCTRVSALAEESVFASIPVESGMVLPCGITLTRTGTFAGMAWMGSSLSPDLVAAARDAGPGFELMVHPGYPDDGWDDFNASPDRQLEYSILRL